MPNIFRPLLLSESLTNDLPLVLLAKGPATKLRPLPESPDPPHPLLTSVFRLLRLSESLPLDFHLPLTKDYSLSLLLESLPLDFHLPLPLESLMKDYPLSLLPESLPLDSHLPLPLANLVIKLSLLSEKIIDLQLTLSEYPMVMPLV